LSGELIAATSALIINNRRMDQLSDSDNNQTMVANRMFESVLNQVKASNLNFLVQQSPFSAVIHLKKSFVKDKTGQILMPIQCNQNDLTTLLLNLDTKLYSK
jgi:hypothetical protein